MKRIHYLTVVLLWSACWTAFSQTRIIAHRGYWKTPGSAQNSIAALMKADSIGVYGSEVDIWLASDGVPVVNHDAHVELNGRKLTVQETPSNTLRQVKLANGEPLPTVEEYLNAFEQCKTTRLIVEFKTHKSESAENELVEKVIRMIREKGLQNRVEYISFGINFVNRVRQIDPDAPVYYLNGDMSPQVIKAMGTTGIDYHYSLFKKFPEWVDKSHDLGLKVNAWTVNSPEEIVRMLDLKVDFITTDEPLLVRRIMAER